MQKLTWHQARAICDWFNEMLDKRKWWFITDESLRFKDDFILVNHTDAANDTVVIKTVQGDVKPSE